LSAFFDQSSGQPGVNPGKQEGGSAEKIKKIGEFSFRGILQPTTVECIVWFNFFSQTRRAAAAATVRT